MTSAKMLIVPKTIGLYVHFPWCQQKCPYCDFNSFKQGSNDNHGDYIDALCADIANSAKYAAHKQISSIFFGGGTPSLFDCHHIEQVLSCIHQNYTLITDCEITIEVNPSSSELEKLKNYYKMGINRVSIGVQSFNDARLADIGRTHNKNDAYNTVAAALSIPFTTINVDIMYGLPGQSTAEAMHDLSILGQLQPPHISWYELTIEANTYFAKYRPQLPTGDTIYAIYESGLSWLESQGYKRYEISAFTQNNTPCKHNLNYWNFGDYIGCGNGACGKITTKETITRTQKHRNPSLYQASPSHQIEKIVAKEERLFEYMLNRLRLMQPFSLNELYTKTGLAYHQIKNPIEKAVTEDYLQKKGDHFEQTQKGIHFMNDCQMLFLPNNNVKNPKA